MSFHFSYLLITTTNIKIYVDGYHHKIFMMKANIFLVVNFKVKF